MYKHRTGSFRDFQSEIFRDTSGLSIYPYKLKINGSFSAFSFWACDETLKAQAPYLKSEARRNSTAWKCRTDDSKCAARRRNVVRRRRFHVRLRRLRSDVIRPPRRLRPWQGRLSSRSASRPSSSASSKFRVSCKPRPRHRAPTGGRKKRCAAGVRRRSGEPRQRKEVGRWRSRMAWQPLNFANNPLIQIAINDRDPNIYKTPLLFANRP